MTRQAIGMLLEKLRKSTGRSAKDLSDAGLLQRFAEQRDEAAFTALVERFGPMVLGVCRRVLGDAHAAEDAFQATFLVLARKASSLVRQELVGNWLWGVAYRTARRARADAARWHDRTREVRVVSAPDPVEEVMWRDLRRVLDEEIHRLPGKYRQPFILSYLEGKTNEEVARKLGCPAGTVFTRLSRARELLRTRLTRRGVTLSGAALAAALTQEAKAALPAGLATTTARAATLFAAGNVVAAGAASISAVSLANGALQAMFWSKCKIAGLVLLVAVSFSGAGTWYTHRLGANAESESPRMVAAAPPTDHPPVAEEAGVLDKANAKADDDKGPTNPSAPAGLAGPAGPAPPAASAPPVELPDQANGFGFGLGFGVDNDHARTTITIDGRTVVVIVRGSRLLAALAQAAVMQELRITNQQIEQVRELQNRQKQAFQKILPRGPVDAAHAPQVLREVQSAPEKMKKTVEAIDQAIDKLLTKTQATRLWEIVLQQQRGHALEDDRVAECLQLTAHQRKQIEAIRAKAERQIEELESRPESGRLRKQVQEAWETAADELLRTLTPEQKIQWQRLTGKRFSTGDD